MTIADRIDKTSYQRAISVQAQLEDLQSKAVDYSNRSKEALDQIQMKVFSASEADSERSQTPPHVVIEYVDLVLIPEGEYLKNQILKVKQWQETYQSKQWLVAKGESVCRRLQFSVETPLQNLVMCRDNFRRAVAPPEKKAFLTQALERATGPVAMNEMVQNVLRGALGSLMTSSIADCVSSVAVGPEVEKKSSDFSKYNKDSYAQQVLHSLFQEEVSCEFDAESPNRSHPQLEVRDRVLQTGEVESYSDSECSSLDKSSSIELPQGRLVAAFVSTNSADVVESSTQNFLRASSSAEEF